MALPISTETERTLALRKIVEETPTELVLAWRKPNGPFFRDADGSGIKEASFFTAKKFKPETLLGGRLWVFEGAGLPAML